MKYFILNYDQTWETKDIEEPPSRYKIKPINLNHADVIFTIDDMGEVKLLKYRYGHYNQKKQYNLFQKMIAKMIGVKNGRKNISFSS